jgi:hypothetical protein
MLYITNIDIGANDITGSKWVPIHVWDNEKDYINLNKVKKSTIKKNKTTHHYGSTGYSMSDRYFSVFLLHHINFSYFLCHMLFALLFVLV